MAKSRWTIISLLVTPILLFVVVMAMGGGHGTYIPAMLMFPWGMVNTIWQDRLTDLSIILGILQFPVYGVFIDRSLGNGKRGSTTKTIAIIVAAHVIMSIVILLTNRDEWS